MSDIEIAVRKVADVFTQTAGNDLQLGEKFVEDTEIIAAWDVIQESEEGQKLFMTEFEAAHGDNPEINAILERIIENGKKRLVTYSKFQAVCWVVGEATLAYRNGGPV
jgi:hypothetical protein